MFIFKELLAIFKKATGTQTVLAAMSTPRVKRLARIALMLALIWPAGAYSQEGRPNVLLVIADDLGYTDLGSFGGEISTPNLDALAQQGLRLTNFYASLTCSPTRAMLMTGVDHHLVGLGSMAEAMAPSQQGQPGYEGYLNERAAFLPKSFADAGYRTLMSGKWHLGLEREHSPHSRGFQQTFALLQGGAGHFSDMSMDGLPVVFRENGEPVELPEPFYSTRFYTGKMIEFIEAGRASGQPFFAYLAYTAPHWPLQAPAASIAKYEGRYRDGYEALAESRIRMAKLLGVASDRSSPIPRPATRPAWSELSERQQLLEQRRMEIYAAMVDDLDAEYGRLIDYLERTGQLDNTIIFFMSDNGAEGNELTGEYLEEFGPQVERCCDNSYENMGRADSYIFYGPGWARASTAPFEGYKGYALEGGIKVPAIIHYPGMPEQGGISDRFYTVKDVLPTLMDLAGVELPAGAELPVEGLPMFSEAASATREMGWELFGDKAYRHGDWKLAASAGLSSGDSGWRLYNLADDPSEQRDFKDERPEIFSDLMRRWQRYEQENGIVYAE